jgi:hypothetical protein
MKATLKFNLPEEQEEFLMAQQGRDYYLIISDLFSEIRSRLKYDAGEFESLDGATLEVVRDWLVENMKDHNLPLE